MNVHEITLDVSKEPAHEPSLYIAQGDKNGTTLKVNVYDNGQALTLTSYTVSFCMRSPDAQDYYEVAGTVSGNVATFLIDETYAAGHPGITEIAYINIINGTSNITSSSRLRVVVLPSAKDGVVPAPAYVSEIDQFIEDAQGQIDAAVDQAEDAAADALEAAEEAREAAGGTVPLMSPTQRGGAKLGTGLEVDSSEKLNVKPATSSAIGAVKPDGTTITVDSDGTLHGSSTYSLPTMSTSVKGGAKLGHGLSVEDDALNLGPLTDSGSGASVQTDGCGIFGVTGEGFAHQDGTPTPDSPQEIRVARGRNLFDPSNMFSGFIRGTNGVFVYDANDKTYVCSVEPGLAHTLNYGVGNRLRIVEIDTPTLTDGQACTPIYLGDDTSLLPYTFTPSKKYVALFIEGTNSPSATNVQLELGSQATPYVPYGHIGLDITANGQTTTTPIPLPSKGFAAKIGDYTDTLEVDSAGGYVWTNQTSKIIINSSNGSSTEEIGASSDGSVYRFMYPVPGLRTWTSATIIPHYLISDRFEEIPSSDSYLYNRVGIFVRVNGTQNVIFGLSSTTANSKNSFLTWLQSNSIAIYYVLAESSTSQGYIDLPELPSGATVTIPELDNVGVDYWVHGAGEIVEHVSNVYKRVEAALAEIATS